MKTPLCTALLLLAATVGLAQTADQSAPDNRNPNAPITRTDDTGNRDWGWLGLMGLVGLGGLAGRNRRAVENRDVHRNATDIRRAA
jgi:LPXTG-motif cell wall-anchored protein